MRSLRSVFGANGDGSEGRGIDWPAYLLIYGAVALGLIVWPVTNGALDLKLGDPDNYVRLVQVRDWLAGQSWWDTTQHRVHPPEGLRLHWSRLADVPLGALISLFALFAERQTAEMLAVVSLPPLLLLITAICLGRAARNIGGAPAEGWARLLLLSAVFVLAQFIPGRVDHHGLQLLLLAAALMSATAPPTRRSGLLVGLWTAISLLIGLENVPILLAIAAMLALNWGLGGPDRRAHLEGYALAMMIALPAFYALSVAPSDWARPTYDEIGRGHIAAIVAGCLGLLLALRIAPTAPAAKAGALAVSALVAGLPLLAFPEVLSHPYAAIDPMLQRMWMDAISETKSAADIARENPANLVGYFWFPAAAFLAVAALYLGYVRKPELLLVVAASLVSLGLSMWQLRAMSSASLVAVLAGAIVGGYLWRHRSGRLGGAVVVVAIVLLNGVIGNVLGSLIAVETKRGGPSTASCESLTQGVDLDRVPPGLVLNGINSGGLILARTDHSVLAVSNHRAIDGNRAAYRIFTSPTSQARAALERNRVAYVLTCRDKELLRLGDLAPDGFAADLAGGRIPRWLIPVPHDGGEDVLFFKVSRDAASAKDPEAAGGPGE